MIKVEIEFKIMFLAVLFLASLKMSGLATFSWWVVFSPLWMPAVILLMCVILLVLLTFFIDG